LIGAAIMAFAVTRPSSGSGAPSIFCSEIINPFNLEGSYEVTVPHAQHQAFDSQFVAFFRGRGLKMSSGQLPLSEAGLPNSYFLSYNSTGCNGLAFVWSSNVAHPDQFLVSFHYNRFYGKGEAMTLERQFLTVFGRKYRITRSKE
jgi:hypothetical protein